MRAVPLFWYKDGEAHLKAKRFRFGVDCAKVYPKAYIGTPRDKLLRKMRRS